MNDLEHLLRDHVAARTPGAPPPYDEVLRRHRRGRTRRATAIGAFATAAAVVVVVGVSATHGPDRPTTVALDPAPTPSRAPGTGAGPAGPDGMSPPPLELVLPDRTIALKASSACYGNGCFDGIASDPLPSVGQVAEVPMRFFHDGWNFQATFSEPGRCPRRVTVPVEKVGPQEWRLEPAGRPGPKEVSIFGRGPEGDLATSFAWDTPAAGTLPEPSASMGLVSADDGATVGYPLELSISDLAETPVAAGAEVTVTAADGASTTVTATREKGRCWAEGSVRFTGTQADADRVAALGPAPFTYDVRLELDGIHYDGVGMWPRDERRDEQPAVDLAFDPPLPAITG